MKHVTLLFLLCSGLSAFVMAKRLPEKDADILSKKYAYKTLSPYEKFLLDTYIEDEFPAGTAIKDVLTDQTSIRSKTRLAQSLLLRNRQGDTENAVAVLRWILKYQEQDEKSRNYGIWRSKAASEVFDQNWREFVGCDLIIIYHHYKNRLPQDIVKGIETGLVHAAKGALKRNVRPDYTNISIMSAFLMDYTGARFDMPEIKKAGLEKAKNILALYNRHHTFSEYNSPTYYGVTLVALAFWRELAVSEEIKQMGATLEKEFWHEVTTFYNPDLKNMPGPYFRGYGMDMQKYYSIMGLWIALALDKKELAPMPSGQGPKFGEVSNIATIFHLGLKIPKKELTRLKTLRSGRYLSRTVPNYYTGDTVKQVTAMINRDWMMGGLWGNRRPWNQIRTGAIHWKTKDSDIGWLLVPGDGTTDVKVSKTGMEIYPASRDVKNIQLFIYAKGASVASFKDKRWQLPGITLKVNTSLPQATASEINQHDLEKEQAISDINTDVFRVVYEIPDSVNPDIPLITFSPEKNNL
ncbi:hypothetical protein DYBT9275_05903 [Dyadobacter sp. CECT 9275]|uniref:Uncharacterized protein n=1 Tax=Dyadobacter helix TaxID=2822344 RepID=A0A916NE77_9BACT|nr:hypothetical protein [Dyadobacter sp. CECT 9275]CAG5018040.1 hypothetical protein DYBT9275_05903 [Dyadobacter sp. CECT 9275]